MKWTEVIGYVFIIGYIAFGLGYFLRRGLTAVNFENAATVGIPVIGIHERTTINIDALFEENGITQIDPTSD